MIKEYFFPKSVEEAVGILSKSNEGAIVISGGTDLIIDLENETIKAEILVDVTKIKGFKDIAFENGDVVIGAGVTMSEVANNNRIQTSVYSLAKATASVGSVQIGNLATMTGNIVRAQPAADSAVMLTALGAWVSICDDKGTRDVLVENTYEKIGKSIINPKKEVVTKIIFKEPLKNQGTAYVRLAQRKALALPMLNVGAMVSLSEGIIEWCRIVMAPVGIKPTRAKESEAFLAGKAPSEELFKEAGVIALRNANPHSSLIRGSREYRLSVLPSLVVKALYKSVAEIKTKGGM